MSRNRTGERGQVAVVLAVVLGMIAVAIIALTMIGQAAIDRTRAIGAADAVALATAQSGDGGAEVGNWYRDRGIEIETGVTASGVVRASAVAGEGTRTQAGATSFAEVAPAPVSVSPALIAVMTRVEQLLGIDVAPSYPSPHVAFVAPRYRAALASLSEPLGLCTGVTADGMTTVSICS